MCIIYTNNKYVNVYSLILVKLAHLSLLYIMVTSYYISFLIICQELDEICTQLTDLIFLVIIFLLISNRLF